MKTKIFFASLLLLLLGCQHEISWKKSATPPTALETDQYECKREAHVVLPGSSSVYAPQQTSKSFGGGFSSGFNKSYAAAQARSRSRIDQDLYVACMKARGWVADQ